MAAFPYAELSTVTPIGQDSARSAASAASGTLANSMAASQLVKCTLICMWPSKSIAYPVWVPLLPLDPLLTWPFLVLTMLPLRILFMHLGNF